MNGTARALRWASAVAVILSVVITMSTAGAQLSVLSEPAPADHEPTPAFPSATVKVWDTLVPIGGIPLGASPGESIEDLAGLTGHGTSFPTVVTVYARSSHPLGPSGVSYWNPDGNIFVWYGKTVGFPGGVDINRTGPAQPTSSPVFVDGVTFGPGDVWVGGLQFQPLYVHFAGTNRFRTFGTPSRLMPSEARAWGVKVDQGTGNVFVVLPSEGVLVRVNPVAPAFPGFVALTEWFIGGPGSGPAGITLDSAGRPYFTVSGEGFDIVARVDPGADGTLGTEDDIAPFWRVPNRDGIRSFRTVPPAVPVVGEEYPNAIITTDTDGNIWFTQSNSNEIGRLSAGPDGILGSDDDVICEYTKPGLANPQQIASTGSGSLLQVYFTEGEGNSVSVLTQAEADLAGPPTRVCTTVPVETLGVPAFQTGAPFFDEEIEPLRTPIVPTVHHVQGLDGAASGTTTTADGTPIPPILRFSPMPNPLLSADGTPIGDAGNGFPSGMTGVYAANRIAGAYLRGNKHFELQSGAVIATPAPPSDGTHPPDETHPPDGDQNGPAPNGLPGRMTGGGSVFTADGRRVTHGFVLRCTAAGTRHDALQINWGDGNRFHLESLSAATCTDDPSISPNPPPAGFDTHTGSGRGRFNGRDGATAEWKFTDAGEPGTADTASIVIRDAAGAVVLEVSGSLQRGNQQAHN